MPKIIETASRHKLLIENFSYLSALQLLNMLLPFVTYPFLIRILGKEVYGLVIFSQAVIGYLVILVGFGFNVSATKEVSIYRDNPEKLSQIVSSVLIIKSSLCFFSLIILSIVLWFIPKAHGYVALFYLTMWLCVYDVVFPVWYFQGVERMKYITWLTLASRLIFVGLILLFIKSPADYLLVPIINGIGAVVAGLASLYIIFISHEVRFSKQPYDVLKYYFKEAIPIFVSNVSIQIYASSNKVILGTFLGMAEVAYYDLGEKLVAILRIPQGLISQTLFPKINKDKDIGFVKKAFHLSLLFNIFLTLVLVIFSRKIIVMLGGEQMLPTIWVVNILVLTVPIVAMSNIFGIQLLIPFGYSKPFSKVIILSGLVYLVQLLLLWPTLGFNIYNISIVTIITETFVTMYLFYLCKRFNLWINAPA